MLHFYYSVIAGKFTYFIDAQQPAGLYASNSATPIAEKFPITVKPGENGDG
jgi:hypothetical protein